MNKKYKKQIASTRRVTMFLFKGEILQLWREKMMLRNRYGIIMFVLRTFICSIFNGLSYILEKFLKAKHLEKRFVLFTCFYSHREIKYIFKTQLPWTLTCPAAIMPARHARALHTGFFVKESKWFTANRNKFKQDRTTAQLKTKW